MKLEALTTPDLKVAPPDRRDRGVATEITGLTCDSRQVRKGYLFAAFPGSRADGRAFIEDAVSRGASAILVDSTVAEGLSLKDVRVLGSRNPRRDFARMAARWYGRQPDIAVAVTGTNGKSSVVEFTRQIWQALGKAAAALGTLGITLPEGRSGAGLTTPDAVALHRALCDLRDRGIEHVAFEASSHGLAQYRVDGVVLRAGAFTNLTHEHLDYHGTFENYALAKLRLFGEILPPGSTAVLNADDAHVDIFEDVCWARGLRTVTYGAAGRDIRLGNVQAEMTGQRIDFEAFGSRYSVFLQLVGEFQALNALAALGLVVACGEEVVAATRVLSELRPVPGRMERAGVLPGEAAVFVDYAHTPDALETVLRALRPHAKGRLHVVFGCGGDRDRGKRPLMGEIATRLADVVIVTNDNPRTEHPAAIRAEILAAAPRAREIGDRREAIATAIDELGDGDVLLIAGKGHESGQIVGEEVFPFSDLDVAREAIACRGGGDG